MSDKKYPMTLFLFSYSFVFKCFRRFLKPPKIQKQKAPIQIVVYLAANNSFDIIFQISENK